MPVQTTYGAAHAAGFEGQKVDLQLTNVNSKVVETLLGIAFGRAVVRGALDAGCKIPSAAGQAFVGISEMTTDGVEDCNGLHQYEYQREANIIDFGQVYVYTEQSVIPGDAVYFRHTAAASPLDVVGRFRKDSSGGNADLIQGASFESTTAAGGLAIVKLNAPGTGILLAPDSSEVITAAGAISLETAITYIESAAAIALTLADGVAGQKKTIKMLVDGGDATLTPANFLDGTTITFDNTDSIDLLFDGTNWGSIGTPSATVA